MCEMHAMATESGTHGPALPVTLESPQSTEGVAWKPCTFLFLCHVKSYKYTNNLY